MYDRFNRNINYLRISVTDRCNLRCIYCMPEDGIRLIRHEDILSYDEITRFTKVSVSYGISKVRITGGEPLARKGVTTLVRMLSEINGISDLSITTNGTLLADYAEGLKRAGLHRVNISLDTIDPVRFARLTRGGKVEDVLRGIDAARDAGLNPVKINCVIKESVNEPDAKEVAEYGRINHLEIRFIRQMDLVNGHFSVVTGGTGGNCSICNRLRLTADGRLKPCLFNDIGFNIRDIGYAAAIEKAVGYKPQCGTVNLTGNFYNIGG